MGETATDWAIAPPAPVEPPQASGSIVRVADSAGFAAAVRSAAPGTVLELATGGDFAGLVVPDGRHGLTICGATDGLATVWDRDRQSPLRVGLGCTDLRISRLRFATRPGPGILYGQLVLGYSADGQREARTVDELPNRVAIHDCEFAGDPEASTRYAILANARHLSIDRCKIDEIHEPGADSQGILATNTPGPIRIRENTIRAAGENVMLGGSNPTIVGVQIADVEISGNAIWKRLEWRTKNWTFKNLIEIKRGVRVRIVENLLQNVWPAAQRAALVVTTRDTGGRIADVEFARNVIMDVPVGAHIAAADDRNPEAQRISNIWLHDNVWNRIGSTGEPGWVYNLTVHDGRPVEHLVIERDRWWHHPDQAKAIMFFEGVAPFAKTMTLRDCTGTAGVYGIIGTATGPGASTMAAWVKDWDATGNAFIGDTTAKWPDGLEDFNYVWR